jgi:hypothetical protein
LLVDLDVRMRGYVLQHGYCLLLLHAADHKTLQRASDASLVLSHEGGGVPAVRTRAGRRVGGYRYGVHWHLPCGSCRQRVTPRSVLFAPSTRGVLLPMNFSCRCNTVNSFNLCFEGSLYFEDNVTPHGRQREGRHNHLLRFPHHSRQEPIFAGHNQPKQVTQPP